MTEIKTETWMIFLLSTLNISRKKALLGSILFPLSNLCLTKVVKNLPVCGNTKRKRREFPQHVEH